MSPTSLQKDKGLSMHSVDKKGLPSREKCSLHSCALCLWGKKRFSVFINLTDSNLNCLLEQKTTVTNTKIIARNVLNL